MSVCIDASHGFLALLTSSCKRFCCDNHDGFIFFGHCSMLKRQPCGALVLAVQRFYVRWVNVPLQPHVYYSVFWGAFHGVENDVDVENAFPFKYLLILFPYLFSPASV